MHIYKLFTVLYWWSASLHCLHCLSHCQTEKKFTCIWRGNDLEEKRLGDINYSLLWVRELSRPKVLRIAPTVVSLTMSTSEKPISYCRLRGYLAINELPSHGKVLHDKNSLETRGWCHPSAEALNPNCVHFKAHLYSHKATGIAVAVYKGMHKQ